jgi:opacity protein-like surface antigen
MSGSCALRLVAMLGLLMATAAFADPVEPGEAPAEELRVRWSLTPTATYHWVESDQEDDDHETGFFDQYEFVPNKSSDFPFQIGVGDASLDLLGPNDTPLLQFRLESPTSNLGVSGSQIDDPFFNQRALLLGRLPGFDLDLRYRRMRTEDTRVFPNTAGAGLLFDDRSGRDERFEAERTGFDAELRARLDELFGSFEGHASRLRDAGAPELSLRGGYQAREGDRQLRFLIDPTNQWIGLAQRRDQEVGNVGGGLVLAPDRLITLDFDFDHERFRESESTILQSALGGGLSPTNNTIGFIPDTDRYTGTARFRSRVAERAVLEGGLQLSVLEQVDDRTPFQHAAGLRDNRLYYSSANFTTDVHLIGALSANGYFKFDQRANDIDRNTALFDDTNGTQVDEFVHRWTRLLGGIEGVYRIDSGNLMALGGRYESIDRDLDFASPIFPVILSVNSLVQDESESYTVYARTQLRALRRIGVSSELGYRTSPETGYVTDLDDYVYGKLRASYTLPFQRSVVLSLFARGGSGDNRNQVMVGGGGLGTPPAGPDLRRHFDRYDWLAGVTANASPWDAIGLFASFFVSKDAQDYELALSSLQRYLQPLTPVTFSNAGATDYENDLWSVVLGTHIQLDERMDAAVSYSFTNAYTHYGAGGLPQLSLVDYSSRIDSDIHSAEIEVGRWLVEGLRVRVGYRFEYYDDGSNLPESVQSAVVPFELTTTRHTVTVGVTLTSALLEKKGESDQQVVR